MVQNDMIQRANAQLSDNKHTPKMSKIQCYDTWIMMIPSVWCVSRVTQFCYGIRMLMDGSLPTGCYMTM